MIFFFKQKTAYEMRISDGSSDVCSSDLEVLAVAFRYTINGGEYQVGEFSTDIPSDPNNQTVLYTKRLKNETLKTSLPTWDLMMKNIYSLQAFQVEQQDFRLDVFRLDESTGV